MRGGVPKGDEDRFVNIKSQVGDAGEFLEDSADSGKVPPCVPEDGCSVVCEGTNVDARDRAAEVPEEAVGCGDIKERGKGPPA